MAGQEGAWTLAGRADAASAVQSMTLLPLPPPPPTDHLGMSLSQWNLQSSHLPPHSPGAGRLLSAPPCVDAQGRQDSGASTVRPQGLARSLVAPWTEPSEAHFTCASASDDPGSITIFNTESRWFACNAARTAPPVCLLPKHREREDAVT